jgi:two-component system NtrC family sensor kinase
LVVDGRQIKVPEAKLGGKISQTDGIIVGDLWGFISDVNDTILDLYGSKNKSDLVGKHVLEFLADGEKDRALEYSTYTMAVNEARTQVFTVHLKNNAEAVLEVTADFIRNDKGESIGFFDIIRKIPPALKK